MNKPFKFKQFSIQHNESAMKVGTDAVLLGSWAFFSNPKNILDVGSGSGILSLMMAQRYADASITGIELDLMAVEEARQNAAESKFCNRIDVQNQAFQLFDTDQRYDAIICNPPFFVDSLKALVTTRNLARHADALPLTELFKKAASLLSENGEIALIIPSGQFENALVIAKANKLFLHRYTHVRGQEHLPFKRCLIQLGATHKQEVVQETLTIETDRHVYTDAYVSLVKDFYLNM